MFLKKEGDNIYVWKKLEFVDFHLKHERTQGGKTMEPGSSIEII